MTPKAHPGRTSSDRPPGQSSQSQSSATATEPGSRDQKEDPKKQAKTENARRSRVPKDVVGGRSAGPSGNVPEATPRAAQAPGKGRYHRPGNKDSSELTSPLQKFKRLVTVLTRSDGFKSVETEQFLHLALQALSAQDRELAMKAAFILGDEECLSILRGIVEAIGNPLPQLPVSKPELKKHIVPFMKVIVHETFSSLSLEDTFQGLLNIFWGSDGEHAVRFFHVTLEHLTKGNRSSPENIYLVSRVLNCVARYKDPTMGSHGLLDIQQRLHDLAKASNSAPIGRRISRSLEETANNLLPTSLTRTTTLNIPSSSTELENATDRLSRFCSVIDGPGQLSLAGIRHDNDFDEIDRISILPTNGELLSSRPPYLPINNLSAPHFLPDGPARLFDIHFRLLREDMLGPIRDAISLVLNNIKPLDSLSKALSPLRRSQKLAATVRFHTMVSIQSASFQKFKGLVFRFRFQQPERLQSLKPHDRINHWKAMHTLESGSLLCLVSNRPNVECFMTVATKNEKALGRDRSWAYTDVVVAEQNAQAQEYLIHLMSKKDHDLDAFALIEFPNILLPAYSLILKNLQVRWKHPYLAFSALLCHQTPSSGNLPPGQVLAIDPPAYAASNHFTYDLAPLRRHKSPSSPLMMSSRPSKYNGNLLRRLEHETTLDHGQCKGLVTALTQELALIQGEIRQVQSSRLTF